MTVYIDIIFLENIIINFIILYATSIISKVNIRYHRLIIASAIGAVFAVVYYIINLKWFMFSTVKIMLSILICFVAFNPKDFKKLIKELLFFYIVSFIFAGASLAVIYMVNSNKINIQNGVIIGNYTLKTILVGILVSLMIIIIAFKIIKKKKSILCKIKIYINQKEIETYAMIDTGNLLKEPITNIPVVVVEHTLLYNIISREILDNIQNILKGDLENIPEVVRDKYIVMLKVIPFSSLGKQNGMLLGIKATKIEIEYEDELKTIDKIILGMYDKSLTKKGEYKALVGGGLLE